MPKPVSPGSRASGTLRDSREPGFVGAGWCLTQIGHPRWAEVGSQDQGHKINLLWTAEAMGVPGQSGATVPAAISW